MIHRLVDGWLVGEYQQMGHSLSHSLYKERSFFGNLQCLHPRNEGGKEKLKQIKKGSPKSEPSVGIPGLEPGKTGPESVVLPLHHIPIYLF